jgi:hypothetical protein
MEEAPVGAGRMERRQRSGGVTEYWSNEADNTPSILYSIPPLRTSAQSTVKLKRIPTT